MLGIIGGSGVYEALGIREAIDPAVREKLSLFLD